MSESPRQLLCRSQASLPPTHSSRDRVRQHRCQHSCRRNACRCASCIPVPCRSVPSQRQYSRDRALVQLPVLPALRYTVSSACLPSCRVPCRSVLPPHRSLHRGQGPEVPRSLFRNLRLHQGLHLHELLPCMFPDRFQRRSPRLWRSSKQSR